MKTNIHGRIATLCLVGVSLALTSASVQAQDVLISGLDRPLGITQSKQGNLLVSESGTRVPNTGRISIVDLDGHRRTLLDGLPGGIGAAENSPSGPGGLCLRGRTLYLAIGIGDSVGRGPAPGTEVPNPNPASPLLSSVLAIHFSERVEKRTAGFMLTLADHQALAAGQTVTLDNGGGDKIRIKLVADLPNTVPLPLPTFPENVRASNPFDLVVVGDQVYVTDGGRNLLWQVDIRTGAFSPLALFPDVANPAFPGLGGPFIQAVPTGIRYASGRLLVALFRGVPFLPGLSEIRSIDPQTGDQASLLTGLKTAIDLLPVEDGEDDEAENEEDNNCKEVGRLLVLQHASATGPFFPPPGLLLEFKVDTAPTVVANNLTLPTSMTYDAETKTVFVTELGGRIIAVPYQP